MTTKTKLPEDIIPRGPFCYFGSRNPTYKSYAPCPYWDLKGDGKNQVGYCAYLKKEDAIRLRDQIKICKINYEY